MIGFTKEASEALSRFMETLEMLQMDGMELQHMFGWKTGEAFRQQICQTDAYTAFIEHVPPGAETPIRDFGPAISYAMVLSGTLLQRRYRKNGIESVEWSETFNRSEKDIFCIGRHEVHSFRNVGNEAAYVLLTHTPAVQTENRYEPLPAFVAAYI